MDQTHRLAMAARLAAKYKRKKQVPSEDGGKTTVYEYSEKQVQHRNREKAKRIEKLRQSIADLRKQYKKDLGSKPEALVVALMDVTYERVGNEESASAGHYGVTGWKVKHVSFSGGKATIKYVGKSGVKHTKVVEDAAVVSALKKAVKGKGPDDVVCEAEAEDANAYLKPFNVSAKDLRGLHANQEMLDRLKTIRSKGGELPSDPKKRKEKLKAEFDKALDEAAGAVGHESATLRSQYLVPGLEGDYLSDGTIQTKLASSGDVMDPQTNLRDIVKQLLLLEQHLAHPDKRCDDCINKHLMTAEALADEAVMLDGGAVYHEICEIASTVCRELQDHYQQGIDPLGLAQTARQLRKDVFSRSVAARVATQLSATPLR